MRCLWTYKLCLMYWLISNAVLCFSRLITSYDLCIITKTLYQNNLCDCFADFDHFKQGIFNSFRNGKWYTASWYPIFELIKTHCLLTSQIQLLLQTVINMCGTWTKKIWLQTWTYPTVTDKGDKYSSKRKLVMFKLSTHLMNYDLQKGE